MASPSGRKRPAVHANEPTPPVPAAKPVEPAPNVPMAEPVTPEAIPAFPPTLFEQLVQ